MPRANVRDFGLARYGQPVAQLAHLAAGAHVDRQSTRQSVSTQARGLFYLVREKDPAFSWISSWPAG